MTILDIRVRLEKINQALEEVEDLLDVCIHEKTSQIKAAYLSAHPLTDSHNFAAIKDWLAYAAENGIEPD